MNKVFTFIFISFLVCCSVKDQKSYRKINEEDYHKFGVADTLLDKPDVLVTGLKEDNSQLLLRIKRKAGIDYYKLDPDCVIENDSTIIAYAEAFKYEPGDGGFQKNGIWFYARFYSDENKKGNFIYSTSDTGIQFSVDSIPASAKSIALPNSEGIYFYEKDALIRLSREQSEDQFNALQKNGFYFIPNSGRLFKRIDIHSIK